MLSTVSVRPSPASFPRVSSSYYDPAAVVDRDSIMARIERGRVGPINTIFLPVIFLTHFRKLHGTLC